MPHGDALGRRAVVVVAVVVGEAEAEEEGGLIMA